MVSLKEFVKRLGNLPDFVMKEGQKVILNHSKQVISMQQKQHHRGVNVSGEKMQGGYSPSYGKRRKKKNLQTGFVDLHFSGKFHKSMKVIPAKGGVDIRSDVDYEKYLRGNFPGEAGLVKENADAVSVLVANELAPKIKKFLVG